MQKAASAATIAPVISMGAGEACLTAMSHSSRTDRSSEERDTGGQAKVRAKSMSAFTSTRRSFWTPIEEPRPRTWGPIGRCQGSIPTASGTASRLSTTALGEVGSRLIGFWSAMEEPRPRGANLGSRSTTFSMSNEPPLKEVAGLQFTDNLPAW